MENLSGVLEAVDPRQVTAAPMGEPVDPPVTLMGGGPDPTWAPPAAVSAEVFDKVKAASQASRQSSLQPETSTTGAMTEIAAAAAKVREAQAKYELAKEEAKSAKAAVDLAQAVLLRTVEKFSADNDTPLFDHVDGAHAAGEAGDDPWRSQLLTDVLAGLTPSILASLAEAELVTLGQLADWTSKKSLEDIPGIGISKARRIETALEEFWQRYRGGAAQEGD